MAVSVVEKNLKKGTKKSTAHSVLSDGKMALELRSEVLLYLFLSVTNRLYAGVISGCNFVGLSIGRDR